MTEFDMTQTIEPRSDQANSEDFLTGPRTFTISKVTRGASAEQPVDLHLAEFAEGRPYKPGKSMRRVLVKAWGADAATYVGRRLTLYCDETVRFGGAAVGGIRISNMSHLDKPLTMMLTVSKGKKAPYVVKPLPKDDPAATILPVNPPANPNAISRDKVTELGMAMARDLEITDTAAKLKWLTEQLERPIKSPTELSKDEGDRLIALIKTWTEPPAEPTLDGME